MSLLGDLLDIRAGDSQRAIRQLGEAFTSPAAAAAKSRLTPAQRKTYTANTRARNAASKPGSGGWDESKHKRGAKGTSAGGKFVSSGSSGETVRTVQQRVGATADGKFGPKTRHAVKRFQKRHGLKVDGIVGHQTALALAGEYTAARKAKPGAIEKDDAARLKRMRKGGKSLRARTRRPQRSSGGIVV